jgi:hypothetical protein
MLRLEGISSCRDAVAARVTVASGGRRLTAWRIGGGSYLSASDPRLHFGLGDRTHVDEVEVAWPAGHRERYKDLSADTGYVLREGASVPGQLRGFGR